MTVHTLAQFMAMNDGAVRATTGTEITYPWHKLGEGDIVMAPGGGNGESIRCRLKRSAAGEWLRIRFPRRRFEVYPGVIRGRGTYCITKNVYAQRVEDAR